MRPLALLAGMAALAACAPAPTSTSTVDVATIRFGHLPVGTVTAAGTAGAPMAHFDITGLQPDSVHSGRVDVTTCGDKRVAPYPPGPVAIRADARGRATGDIPGATVPFYFHLDVVPGGTAPVLGQELACAATKGGSPARLEVLDPYNRAGGEARLRYDRATRVLEVTVVVDGLAPRSHHPNHIHTGQCEMEGPVRDVLQPIDADATGRATVTTRIPESDGIRRGVWYIAVHNGPQLGSQDQYAVLACGNVP